MKWQKPPKSSAGRGMSLRIDQDVAELRKNPGEWALVREGIRTASPVTSYKTRGCVATSHRVNTAPDRFDIYAMWPADETRDVKGDDAIVDVVSGLDCG